MKKLLIPISAVILILIIMYAFNICPPEGPWPSPPWCQHKVVIENKTNAINETQEIKLSEEKYQINFTVLVPEGTDKVYFEFVDFPNPFWWYEKRYEMKKINNTLYTINISLGKGEFIRYRYSRGDFKWEVDADGIKSYRMFKQGNVSFVRNVVYSWEDTKNSVPTRTIKGWVFDEKGNPIIDAQVEIGSRFGLTNSYGYYEITKVPVGENSITILEEKVRHPLPTQHVYTLEKNFTIKETLLREITINVIVPNNTPSFSKVMIFGTGYDLGTVFHGDEEVNGKGVYAPLRPVEMTKIGENLWQIKLRLSDGEFVRYSYTTGGPLVNVAQDERGEKKYYSFLVDGDMIINDTVYSWDSKNLHKVEINLIVPNNTPNEKIFISFLQGARMFKINDTLYKNIFYLWPYEYEYSYSLSNVGYSASPQFSPDVDYKEWNKVYSFNSETTSYILNKINGWRWWPKEINNTIPKVSKIEFAPREFQKGVEISDWWWTPYFYTINETNKRIKEINAEWVRLSPVMEWRSQDPPKLTLRKGYCYSTNDLITHIKSIKNSGLKVLLAPQICCRKINTTNKNETWWKEYWNEIFNYVNYFSKIANETNTDEFLLTGLFEALPGNAPNATENWNKILKIIRSNFKGRIGYSLYILPDGSGLWLSDNAKSIINKFDFVSASMWNPLCEKNNESREIIREKIENTFNNLETLHNAWDKPFIIEPAYPSAIHGCMGTKEYSVDDKRISMWEKKNDSVPNDMTTHAIIFDELMRAIATRNWIIGFYPFGYHYQDMQDKGYNIRTKPASYVLKEWYLEI